MSNEDDNSEYGGFNDRNYEGDYHQRKHAMPIKPHIKQIEDFIAEVRKECDENKKTSGILKGDLNVLGHKGKEKCNELTKLIMEDLHNLEKEFKRTVQSDRTEIDFFKQQLHGLNQDKIKIKQSSISLDTRLKQCETDVGMGFAG
mmetsp:Transcript_13818/g.14370  ORF Transcript_13818/g.14370 Transcript_13818/m.14370 type:complete len:145 (+) Transcript_13818:19-453(+)